MHLIFDDSAILSVQSKAKSKLDQIEEKGDEEDVHIGGSFDKLGNASNAAQLVNTKATKQKRKKTSPSNKNSAKLSNRAEPCIKKSDANQQGSNRRKSAALKSCQKSSSAVGRNTSGRRNKASSNSKPIHGSSDNSPESYLPKEGLDVEAPDKPLSERIQNLEKTSRRKGSARKLEMAGKTISDTTEKNSEPRSKRVRRMSDHAIAKPVEVPSGSGNETEIPQLHTLTKGSIQCKSSNARRHSKVCGEQEGKNKLENTTMTPIILHGKCQNKEAVCTAPSVRTASVKYKQAKFSEQPDCFGTENFGNLQACPARNVLLKKCEVSTLKVSCAFCQTDVITEVSSDFCRVYMQMSFSPNLTYSLLMNILLEDNQISLLFSFRSLERWFIIKMGNKSLQSSMEEPMWCTLTRTALSGLLSFLVQDNIRKKKISVCNINLNIFYYFLEGLLMSTSKMILPLILQLNWREADGSNVLAVELKELHLDALR